MSDTPASKAERAPSFADLLNHLFSTHTGAKGRPFSLREVSEGTGGKLSIAYLSLLRRGGNVGLPSADKVKALSDFFSVDIGYFLGAEHSAGLSEAIDPELVRALANPQVRDIALRASALTDVERQFIVQMLEHAHGIFSRTPEHKPPARSTNAAPQ